MFYLKLFVNCFRDLNYEKEFGNVRIPTIAPKISSFGIIMGYLLNARFPNHKSGDGWSPGKKPIDGTSEESDRLPGCLNFICGRFTPNYGSFRSIGITLCKEGKMVICSLPWWPLPLYSLYLICVNNCIPWLLFTTWGKNSFKISHTLLEVSRLSYR